MNARIARQAIQLEDAMRIITTLAISLFVAANAAAQTFTVLDSTYDVAGGFGAGGRVGLINDQIAVLGALQAAIVVDHETVIGVEAVGLLNHVSFDDAADAGSDVLQVVYGGVLLEHVFMYRKTFHPLIRCTIGGGGISVRQHDALNAPVVLGASDGVDFEFDPTSNQDAFFVLEPGIGVELNITQNVRLEIAALYRIVAGVATEGISNGMFTGPSVGLTIKSGVF